MMALKILALFFILSSNISFSTSRCFATTLITENFFFSYKPIPSHLSPHALVCSDISLNKENQLKRKYYNWRVIEELDSIHVFNSNISKLYDNTLEGFKKLQHVMLINVSLHEIDLNVFVNWTKISNLILAFNELTTIDFHLPPNIENLNISHNNISHIKALQNYNKLVVLDLSYNSIIRIEGFGPFDALRTLDLSHNNLSSLANITWKNEQVLDSLLLSHNNLEYIPPNIETILIKHLDLSHNNISNFDCKNVTDSINLGYNKFYTICNFSKTLTKIDFSYNTVTYISGDTFKKLEKLEYLNLSCNYIQTIYPSTFHDLINLKILDLSDNNISILSKGLFYHLEKLKTLYIAMNYIEKIEHGTFTGLNSLQILNVSDNKIDNLNAIYSLKQLRELNIIDNNLYELDVDQIIKHFPYLRKISYNTHSVSCEELMVYILKFRATEIRVKKGDFTFYDNVNGFYCKSDPDFKIKNQESNYHKMAYISNYLSRISVALIVILVILVFVIILILFTLYKVYTKHRNQTQIDHTLHSCSLKLLSENDPLN